MGKAVFRVSEQLRGVISKTVLGLYAYIIMPLCLYHSQIPEEA
jgi:hypothetical protein